MLTESILWLRVPSILLLLLLLPPPMTTPLLLLPLLNCINPPELGITIRRAPINKFLLPISPILNIKEKIANYYSRRCTKFLIIKKRRWNNNWRVEKGQDVWGVTPSLMAVGTPSLSTRFPHSFSRRFLWQILEHCQVPFWQKNQLVWWGIKRVQDSSSSDDDKV